MKGHCYGNQNSPFCDDVFAETADLAIMDAWLSRYIEDYRGHTFVLVRNPEISSFIKKYKNELEINSVATNDILESQKSVIKLKVNNKLFAVNGFGSKLKLCEKTLIYLKFMMQNMSKNYSENKNKIRALSLLCKIINKLCK